MLPEDKQLLIANKGGRYISATKIKTDYKIHLECPNCNSLFDRKWSSIRTVGSVICFKCARAEASKKRINPEDKIRKVVEAAGAQYVKGYTNAHSEMVLRCSCGNEYTQTYSDFLSIQRAGRPARCKSCALTSVSLRQTLSSQDAQDRISATGCTLKSDYVDYINPLLITCRLCSNDWLVSLKDFTNNGTHACPTCTCNDHKSIGESQLADWLRSEGVDVEQSNRTLLGGQELDIIATLNGKTLVIEYNGVYYHSERFGRTREYHLNKTVECQTLNLALFHVWDVHWNTPSKRLIVQSMIRLKLGLPVKRVPARKVTINQISSTVAKSFTNANHLHGFIGASIHLGMYYNGDLVGVMSLGQPRYEAAPVGTLELYRLSFCKNVVVMGGFEKFLSSVERDSLCTTLTSYVDRSFSTGASYFRCGFTLENITSPGYHYEKSGRLFSRHKFQKHKLASVLERYTPSDSELVNMKNSGYSRVWDCGHFKFTKPLKGTA